MPKTDRTTPDLAEQRRWQRELDASRFAARQVSPGFFPGPGAAAAPQAPITAQRNDATATAQASPDNDGQPEQLGPAAPSPVQQTSAQLFKLGVVDKVWWPAAAVFPANLIFIPCLQVYWMMSMAGSSRTVPMQTWEHVILGLITLLELAAILLLLVLVSMMLCVTDSGCLISAFSSSLF